MTRNRNNRYNRNNRRHQENNHSIPVLPDESVNAIEALPELSPAFYSVYMRIRGDIMRSTIDAISTLLETSKFNNYSKRTCDICANSLVGDIITLPCCSKQIHFNCYIKSKLKCPYCRENLPLPIEMYSPNQLDNEILGRYIMISALRINE